MFTIHMRAAVAALALGLVAPAMAADAGLPTRPVSYADLDLTAPAGVAMFERRVSRAVREVCRSANLVWAHQSKCRSETGAVAAVQVDRVVIAALQRRDVQLAAR